MNIGPIEKEMIREMPSIGQVREIQRDFTKIK
jgi:hypothetical protein